MVDLKERFLTAIVAGDFQRALAAASEARERGMPFLYEQIVGPALVEIGSMWQAGRLSVADEHIATALTQSVLASFYPTFPWAIAGPKAIMACVAGERHELGARMAADLLGCDGWNVRFVGADLPLDALLALVARDKPIFVGLSVALPEHLPSTRDAIAELRSGAPGIKIIVGGRAVAGHAPPLLPDADDVASSATSAVVKVRGWKP
jgi:methanogenic corrinoid protein MtbC1